MQIRKTGIFTANYANTEDRQISWQIPKSQQNRLINGYYETVNSYYCSVLSIFLQNRTVPSPQRSNIQTISGKIEPELLCVFFYKGICQKYTKLRKQLYRFSNHKSHTYSYSELATPLKLTLKVSNCDLFNVLNLILAIICM